MADLKISQLNSLPGSSLANSDVLAVVDVSASETKKITSVELVRYGYGLISTGTLDGDIIEAGTTSARGTIQLTDATDSTSTTTASTPNAVKSAYDLANAALPAAGGTISGNLTVSGDLTVSGTTTTIDTTTLVVEDKNIELGNVDTPTDVTADGGGITLLGNTSKTINWVNATDAWTFSEHVDLATAKEFRINGTKVLDATSLGSGVVSSSLTSVGTIGTGTWQGTAVGTGYGGTGQTSYTDGELLIGNSTGNTLDKATLTAGSGVTITNGNGSIEISATGSGGSVTSVDVSGGTGLTSSGGPVTTSGTITIDLDDTAVTPGSYTYATITVDQQGRLTAASNGTTPLTSSDIGSTVQAYDVDTAKYDDATANFTGTLQQSGSNVVIASDIGSTVQAYDADTAKTDTVQSFTAAQRGSSVTLTSGATITPDFADGNNFDLSLGVNATLANPSNLATGQSGVIVITNGAYTLAFGSYWKFAGGTVPTITQSAVSVIAYYVESATRITAQAILNVS